jgi:hypothetical protein
MLKELGQKSEEIRKYHVEQTVVFGQIRELIGHPGKIVNKARLYDQLVESGEPVSARHTTSYRITSYHLTEPLWM